MAGQHPGGPPRPGPIILPRLEPDFVKHVADSMGIANLTLNGTIYICEQVSHLLKRVVYDAQKFAVHGRRAKVVGADIEAALRLAGLENLTPLGHTLPNPPPMAHVPNPYGLDLFAPDDTEVDLAELREHPPAALPAAPYIRAHWLVYNGKVPRIPENVEPAEDEDESDEAKPSGSGMVAARRESGAADSSSAGATFKRAAREVSAAEQVVVQQVQAESLSVEQQRYFKEVVEACVGTDDKKRQEALQSLETDTGVQALMSRFSGLISDSVRLNTAYRCMSMLIYIVRMIRAIANNPSVKMEPYLHEIIPSLLSCMIGRNLCNRPDQDNHWALRDFSGKTLVSILNAHEKAPSLRVRVYRSLKKVFDDPNSTFAQIFGTATALNEIMTMQERYECYNRYVDLTNACHPSATSSLSPEGKAEAGKLYQVLLKLEQPMLRAYRRISENI